MYYPYFITYIVLGIAITLAVFFWALKNGQFRDQQRARFLPLEDGSERVPAGGSRWNHCEAYSLVFLAVAGLAASIAVLVFGLYFGG